ncbi:MAG TPA: putative DNA-binding domain-containing protein [Rhodocyclaceae bacterium]|nr:putative DNA-binding domain-containing protein [Rhodocyclaceae bacterium]
MNAATPPNASGRQTGRPTGDFGDFRDFQMAFGRHVRDPRHHPRPPGVPARRMAVYNELLFNNLTGFLDACFPVCRQVLGDPRWRRLNRAFYREWRSPTPYFREIPREFLRWLLETETTGRLPRWFRDLAHYEWVELAVDTMEAPDPPHDPAGDPMDGEPVLAPASMNLAYAWPVHRIGPAFRPRKPEAAHLLVFRDREDGVRFIALNPVTARLVSLLGEGGRSGRACAALIARELGHPDPGAAEAGARDAIGRLRDQQAILGVRP